MHAPCAYEEENYHFGVWTAVGVGAVVAFVCWPRTYTIVIGASSTDTIAHMMLILTFTPKPLTCTNHIITEPQPNQYNQ